LDMFSFGKLFLERNSPCVFLSFFSPSCCFPEKSNKTSCRQGKAGWAGTRCSRLCFSFLDLLCVVFESARIGSPDMCFPIPQPPIPVEFPFGIQQHQSFHTYTTALPPFCSCSRRFSIRGIGKIRREFFSLLGRQGARARERTG